MHSANLPEPFWLRRAEVDVIHFAQLREHGGIFGVRDENLLESAIARPRQKWTYQPESDLALLGAAYAFGLAMNHPWADGNKRAAFVVMAVFCSRNGSRLKAPEAEAVITMLGVAAGKLGEVELASWIRAHLVPVA